MEGELGGLCLIMATEVAETSSLFPSIYSIKDTNRFSFHLADPELTLF